MDVRLTAGVVAVRAIAGHAGDHRLAVGQGRWEAGSLVPVWRTEILDKRESLSKIFFKNISISK